MKASDSMLSPRDPILREERVPAGVLFVAGVWVIMAPFVLDYSRTFAGTAGYINDVVCGAAIAVAALACVLVPRVASRLALVTLVLGLWLIVAPFAFGYPALAHRDAARASDIFAGIVVAMFSVISMTIAVRRRGRQ